LLDIVRHPSQPLVPFFIFKATPTADIYTLSLHDALPIYMVVRVAPVRGADGVDTVAAVAVAGVRESDPLGQIRCREREQSSAPRSEEHTSELQSRGHLVCRLLLEKKKKKGMWSSNIDDDD